MHPTISRNEHFHIGSTAGLHHARKGCALRLVTVSVTQNGRFRHLSRTHYLYGLGRQILQDIARQITLGL